MSGPVIDWSEAHLAILKAGVAAGDSYTQIAKRIPLCTRCAAIGKAKRLGLSQGAAPSAPSGIKALPSPQHRTTLRIAGRGTVFEQSEAHPPRAAVPSRSEPPGKRTILTVGSYECRWPIGEPGAAEFTLCGAKTCGARLHFCSHPKLGGSEVGIVGEGALMEVWRDIPGIEYQASDLGRVRRSPFARRQPGRVLTPKLGHGYLSVAVQGGGRTTWHNLHRLVCMAFHGPPPTPKHHACHRDGSRDQNRPDNLLWGTPAENNAHKRLHGTHQVGGRHPRAVVTDERVGDLRTAYAQHMRGRTRVSPGWLREASEREGIAYHTLRKILKGRGYPVSGGIVGTRVAA
jgi:hypothetical protein